MSEAVSLTFGSSVTCDDGEGGELGRVVVDSYECAITHLVVGPMAQEHAGRMVPIDLVDAITPQGVRLRCTTARFEGLDPLQETEVRTASTVDVESQWAEVRSMERFSRGHVDLGMGLRPDRRLVADENIGEGQGEIWQGQHVHASDGPIGRVRGIVADAVWHSGKTRAEHTARIIAQAIGCEDKLAEHTNLAPGDDPAEVASEIEGLAESDLVVVGHLPFLPRLTALLTGIAASVAPVRFRNAGIVALSRQEGAWALDWAVVPELFDKER